MKFVLRSFMLLSLSVFLSACAFDVMRLKQIPVELRTDSVYKESFSLTDDIKVPAGPGYSRILKAGTRWECVGEISQGKVYQTKDQILTVEASNVFEAFIVVTDQKLVGYYLPIEGTFFPLDDPEKLPIN